MRDYVWTNAIQNDIRLNRVANGNAEIDSDVRTRENGIEYFLARLFTSVFPNAIRR